MAHSSQGIVSVGCVHRWGSIQVHATVVPDICVPKM
jgi:hypothetical protein